MEEMYYTLEEISIRIKTPIAYLRRMIKENKLKAHCIGRTYKVSESEIKEFISSCGVRHV